MGRPGGGGALISSRHLNYETNVLVLARLDELKGMSTVNLIISFVTMVYIGINVVNVVLNGYDNEAGPPEAATTKELFHNLEFWATFVFTVAQVVSLAYAPKPLVMIYKNVHFLKLIIVINVCASFIGALLVSINVEKFEVPSHLLEYANEITMSIFDMMILISLLKSHGQWNFESNTASTIIILLVALLIALAQMAVYNGMGITEEGERRGEQSAHYLEFSFEIISASITYWFTMDNKFLCDMEILKIMFNQVGRTMSITGDFIDNGVQNGKIDPGEDTLGTIDITDNKAPASNEVDLKPTMKANDNM